MLNYFIFQRRRQKRIPKKCIWNQKIIGFKDLFINKKNNKSLAFDDQGLPKRGVRLTDNSLFKDDSLFMIQWIASGHRDIIRPRPRDRFPRYRGPFRNQNKRSSNQMQNDAPAPPTSSPSPSSQDTGLSTTVKDRRNKDKSAARRRSDRRRAKKTEQSFGSTYDQETSLLGFSANIATPWPEVARPTLPSWLESKLSTSTDSRRRGRKSSSKKASSSSSRTRNKNKKKRKSKRNKKSKPLRHRSRNNR